ncbi:3-hydroxyacyl-ACP dehydratase FabZ family protein [Kutzneria buriramensis]|uniref:3-hydroxyacyl-[acyl-carrier-protein] dehydratase n=1 Tax=Kutzneria buriramensis TaxID=1045776 RepID=A0A3E0HPL6_9PSEU|nr:3-hydroxyacyl-ACP dehydratase [Kutzneria buriramensis]REH48483.1 3-hydroxyacyl-[acyl-carrier-protein] dehydratase [Kutzneria buriramensis]
MIGVDRIKRIIPHRHPILLVDRVSTVEPGRSLVAHKAVTAAEPCYQRLGDDTPAGGYAYPISLLLESWAQSAVLLACWEQPNPDVLAGKVELAAGIAGVRLLRPVYPGHTVEHRVEIVRSVDDAAVVAGGSLVDDQTVLEVKRFTVALRDSDVLRRPSVGASR